MLCSRVPTLNELGRPNLPGLSFTLNVAAGTPAPIVATLHEAAAKALNLRTSTTLRREVLLVLVLDRAVSSLQRTRE